MFGTRKSIAISRATSDLRICIRTMERTCGLPCGFWNDAYVLGFLFGYTGAVATIVKPSAGSSFRGEVADAAMQRLCGAYYDAPALLTHIKHETPDFVIAVSRAVKLVFMTNADTRFDRDPDVLEAIARATKTGRSLDGLTGETTLRSRTLMELTQTWFFKEVCLRFGIPAWW